MGVYKLNLNVLSTFFSRFLNKMHAKWPIFVFWSREFVHFVSCIYSTLYRKLYLYNTTKCCYKIIFEFVNTVYKYMNTLNFTFCFICTAFLISFVGFQCLNKSELIAHYIKFVGRIGLSLLVVANALFLKTMTNAKLFIRAGKNNSNRFISNMKDR